MSGGWLAQNGTWLAAYLALGVGLLFAVELGAGDIAAPLSVVILTGVFVANGPAIFAELDRLTGG